MTYQHLECPLGKSRSRHTSRLPRNVFSCFFTKATFFHNLTRLQHYDGTTAHLYLHQTHRSLFHFRQNTTSFHQAFTTMLRPCLCGPSPIERPTDDDLFNEASYAFNPHLHLNEAHGAHHQHPPVRAFSYHGTGRQKEKHASYHISGYTSHTQPLRT